MNYEEIESFLRKAEAENETGHYAEAEKYCNLALEKIPILLHHEIETSEINTQSILTEEYRISHNLRARAMQLLCDSQYRRGKADEAIICADEALRLAAQTKNKELEAGVLNTLGNVYLMLSDYSRALDLYMKALAFNEEIVNKSGMARNTGNIGNVYSYFSDYPRALEYYTKAISNYKETGNKQGLAINYGNIGLVYYYLSNYPQSLEFYTKSKVMYEEIGNKRGAASNYGNMGMLYSKLSDYNQVLEYFTKALNIYEEIGDRRGVARNIGNIGTLYVYKDFELYDPNKAEEYLLKALNMFEETEIKDFEIHKKLSELYEHEEQWEQAHEQFKKYHEIEKEVLSKEAKKQAELMEYRRKIEESERDRQVKLARFQEQEKILHNILPAQIADRILEGEKRIANLHEHVSVFFSDIVGFTKLSQTISPDELLTMLNEIFSEFDRIARKHGLEKIKTIGDAYMAVAGVPLDQEDHAERTAGFALEVIEYMKEYRKKYNSDLQIRVGLHSGRAIAGVIGENKFAYDLWGDSVNTASRMESHGEAGRIHVSEDFRNALSKSDLKFLERGEMEVKGKGKMKTYFLESKI